MNIFKQLFSPQLGSNWIDRSPRGNGNRAARKAAKTGRYSDHRKWIGEDIYTDRPWIFKRADWLHAADFARANGRTISAME